MKYTIANICGVLGFTRQAYYKHQNVKTQQLLEEQIILQAVGIIRRSQPRLGGKKIYLMLPKLDIQVGRDKLFDILRKNNLLIKPKKNYKKTTNSFHRFRKHPNLIKELEVTKPNQVFVADITYLDTLEGFCYLSLITDLYSRKIVGWNLSQSLAIEGCQRALRMALKGVEMKQELIHHSDRGIQYCSYGYVKILKKHNIHVSMTGENHVYENAIAERVNGILKIEFLLGEKLQTFEIAKELVKESIKTYNEQRLHMSLNYDTPAFRYAA